jgi:preprotein translocase subunit SecY
VRLTHWQGRVYITLYVCCPSSDFLKYNVPFYFGGTSLMIIVVVTMDFMAQVQNYMMSQQYESLLKGKLQNFCWQLITV